MLKKPQVLAEGSYGCVHKPSLECDDNTPKINYSNKVSKLLSSKNAKKELQEYVMISEADKSLNYYLGEPIHCDYDKSSENTDAIKKCKLYDKIKSNKNQYELIIMKDGGDNLKTFADKYYINSLYDTDSKQSIMENTKKMKKFWNEAIRLLYGIKYFIKHDIIHHDIKPHNIVYNESKNRCNFIDFGIMNKISILKKKSRINKNGLEMYWWNYPIENNFVNNSSFKREIDKNKDNGIKFDFDLEKNKDQLSVFFDYTNINTDVEKTEHVMKWYNFVVNNIHKYNYEKFLDKHYRTMDSYALGMTLLYVLNKTKRYIEDKNFLAFKELFTRMFSADLHDRIDIDEAIEKYENIISKDKINVKANYKNALDLEKSIKSIIKKTNMSKSNINEIAESDPVVILKKCPEGKVLNPKTDRCIKKKTEKVKKCPEGKVLNPKTGRCIKKKTEKVKKCPEGKVLNPKTGRCIRNKTLKIKKIK